MARSDDSKRSAGILRIEIDFCQIRYEAVMEREPSRIFNLTEFG